MCILHTSYISNYSLHMPSCSGLYEPISSDFGKFLKMDKFGFGSMTPQYGLIGLDMDQ